MDIIHTSRGGALYKAKSISHGEAKWIVKNKKLIF